MLKMRCYVILFALFVVTIFGCKKEDDSIKWLTFCPADMGIDDDLLEASLVVDTGGGVYVLNWNRDTEAVEYAYRSEFGSWRQQQLLDYDLALNYTTASDDDGSVWLLAEAYLYHVLQGEILNRFEVTDPAWTLQSNSFRGVATGAGRVWLLNSRDGVHELNKETGELTHYPDTSSVDNYDRITADDFGNVWVAKDSYYSGLMHLTPTGEWEYIDRSNPVFDCPSCYPVYQGHYVHANRLEYSATNQLYMLTRNTDNVLPVQLRTLENDSIVPLTENLGLYTRMRTDPLGGAWVYAHYSDGTLAKHGSGSVETINISQAYGSVEFINDMQFDGRHNMWISTIKGVAVYNKNGVAF